MGTIRAEALPGAQELVLSPVTRVGRASANELHLDDARVSQFHAVIAWATPGVWEVRDLGSSNGTFVDGSRLDVRHRRALAPGARIGFGDPHRGWTLVDDARPAPEVWDLATGARVIGTTHLLTVPGDDGPSDILEEASGHWVLERNGAVVDVHNGQTITLGGRRYRIVLPLPLVDTEPTTTLAPTGEPLEEAKLTFAVSHDLDWVGLRVEWAHGTWESSRAYNRALLVLAQARLRDAARAGSAPHSHGWVYADEVCTLADYEGVGRLNVEVHRARTDFARQGIPGAPTIVQRRRGTGQIRLGTGRIVLISR